MAWFRGIVNAGVVMLVGASTLVVVPVASADDKYASSPTPSRVVLGPSADPSTSQAFAWRTDATTISGQVEVTTPEGTPVAIAPSNPGEIISFPFPNETWTASYTSRHHEATVTGLTPDTKYRYRVGGFAGWSPWYEFRTAAAGARKWRMLYFGDVQTNILEYSEIVMDRAYEAVPDARVALHAGDLINDSEQDYQWGEWFEIADGHSQNIVTAPVMGNHELHGDDDALQYHQHFNNPKNGPAEFLESAYHFDYQGVRFLILNSNKDWAPDQVDYVRSVLANNPNKWTVVSFHHPVFSSSWNDRDNKDVRDSWMPLFEEYNVDLVLQGHDHIYSRGHLKANQTAEGEQRGPVYVISMAGAKQYPAPLPGSNIDNWTPNGAVAVKTEPFLASFQDIEFDGDYLRYHSVVANMGSPGRDEFKVGDTVDSFTVIKRDGEQKRVVEGLQYAPETKPDPVPEPLGKFRILSAKAVGKTGKVKLRIKIPTAGKIEAKGKLKSGPRRVTVTGKTIAKSAGITTVTVRPKSNGSRALKKLRRGAKVNGKITVTYSPKGDKVQRMIRSVAFRR